MTTNHTSYQPMNSSKPRRNYWLITLVSTLAIVSAVCFYKTLPATQKPQAPIKSVDLGTKSVDLGKKDCKDETPECKGGEVLRSANINGCDTKACCPEKPDCGGKRLIKIF